MKKICLFAFALVACGESVPAESCRVEKISEGVKIVCPDTEAVVYNGTDGNNGLNGVNGVDGQDGVDGTDNRIVASIGCFGLLEDTDLAFSYRVAQMASGDVWSSGNIKTPYSEVGASSYFSYYQVGFITAPVSFTFDLFGTSNFGWWNIGLNRNTLVTVIEYNDTELSTGKMTWTMSPENCVVNTY